MILSKEQQQFIEATGYMLVKGGPGSGKTTVSIMKAAKLAESIISPEQKILFLSFARATVARVIEAIEHEQKISKEIKRKISVETYHAFFWRILNTHGYLIGLPRSLSILSSATEAIALSNIRKDYPKKSEIKKDQIIEKQQRERQELLRLAMEDGHISFSLFAELSFDILKGSKRIRKLISCMHPYIILDEFQDTNKDQWNVVKSLGEYCTLLALADPEQQIYGWLGADPDRLIHFEEAFSPLIIDLGGTNHRSANTDIVTFGNDILKGSFSKDSYEGISIKTFESFRKEQPFSKLIQVIYEQRTCAYDRNPDNWSLAVLVPTKKMTRLVSDALYNPPASMNAVVHIASIEVEAALLSAELVAHLLQTAYDKDAHFEKFIDLLCQYYQGRGGDTPSNSDINEAVKIQQDYSDWKVKQSEGRKIRQNSVHQKLITVYEKVRGLPLSGKPDQDWREVCQLLEASSCKRLQKVAIDVKDLRLLSRGMQLNRALSDDWIAHGSYKNAHSIVHQSFVEEQLSLSSKPEAGVVIMNIDKSKGKQFDQVIIFEGWPGPKMNGRFVSNSDRIVRGNMQVNKDSQTRQKFRVAVTRAKYHTTILTPKIDICCLFTEQLLDKNVDCDS